jgi:carbonic anhydrase/acetyltransferase-like protein (isoleucine patch superfamily)
MYRLGDKKIETVGDDFYIAPGAAVIGQVRLGRGATVWFGCVLRGDSDWINIGDGTNVQDGTVIHTDAGEATLIGPHVSIGHRAMLHGCTVGEFSLIANGAMVLDGAVIGRHCLIAAGALIPPRKVIPDGSVVMGSPGKIVRSITDEDRTRIRLTGEHYVERGREYRRDLAIDQRSAEIALQR